jgi:hypothetical protein
MVDIVTMSTEKLPGDGSPAGTIEPWLSLQTCSVAWDYTGGKKGKKKGKKTVLSLNTFLSGSGTPPPSKAASSKSAAGNWADSTDDIDPSG